MYKQFSLLKCFSTFFLDNAQGRLSASSTKCAEGVPGKWTDQVLYIRQPNHCEGRSTPWVSLEACKTCVQ